MSVPSFFRIRPINTSRLADERSSSLPQIPNNKSLRVTTLPVASDADEDERPPRLN